MSQTSRSIGRDEISFMGGSSFIAELVDKFQAPVVIEYERLQKKRVDIEGDCHDKIEPKPIKIVSRKDERVNGRY